MGDTKQFILKGTTYPMNEKYPEKNPNYSPSISYNYSPQSGYNGNSQMHPRRRNNDRFRRDPVNLNERIVKQNDIIIRLLKEIRDRLPAPRYTPPADQEAADQPGELQASHEPWDGKDETARDGEPDKADESPDQDAKNARMSGPDEEIQ
jgi:hypothetical protein